VKLTAIFIKKLTDRKSENGNRLSTMCDAIEKSCECCVVSALQTQLAQQHDMIKELEERIAVSSAEMIKVQKCCCL